MTPKSYPIWLVLLSVLFSTNLRAVERVSRKLDSSNGPLLAPVFHLAQDSEGFIWLGTVAGLVRYDGSHIHPWAKNVIVRDIGTLTTSTQGEIAVAEARGTLYRVVGDGVEPIAGPDGKPITGVTEALFDGVNRLWVKLSGGDLLMRDAGQVWHTFNDTKTFPGERITRVRLAEPHDVFILTNRSIWQISPEGDKKKILTIDRPIDVVSHPTGSIFVLAWPKAGQLLEVRDQQVIRTIEYPARPIDVVVRGRVVWAAFDRFLVSVEGNEEPKVIGPEDNLPSGGPLLVDNEGSLWLGTFSGLLQFPEPQTTLVTQKDGLPSNHVRWVARTAEGLWVSYWGGLALLQFEKGVIRSQPHNHGGSRGSCIDDKGTVWSYSGAGLLLRRVVGGSFVPQKSPELGGFYMCEFSSTHELLLGAVNGLFRLTDDRVDDIVVPRDANGNTEPIINVYEDQKQRIWISVGDGGICHAPLTELNAGNANAWSCQTISSHAAVFDIAELPSGELWAATNGAGLWRFRENKWEPHPASRTLPSAFLFSLDPSPTGGVWMLGHGISMRVVENLADAEGWTIEETLSSWDGLPASGGVNVVEESDGQLWISTSQGVVHIPKDARLVEARAPRVKLVDLIVNGQTTVPKNLKQLPNGSSVELHFAALSFRDRTRLRYQYRLNPNANWIDLNDTSALLRFLDMRSGSYLAEVRASLDGYHWSTEPARLSFQVLSPWYLRPWAILAFVLSILGVTYLAHRARVGVLLRLERQRAEIAMDLHDEMGSGLGSIGILSELAAEDHLERSKQRELTREIAETASELGTALTEIVWTLRPGTTTLESLAYHLAERGGRLFPSERPSFSTDFPESWPHVELSLAVRRNLLLIASEALHNARRHAQAERVVLGVAQLGSRWRLWITDDGHGLESTGSESSNHGMGLENMRRRATDIQAALTLETDGNGTTVAVVFEPRATGVGVR